MAKHKFIPRPVPTIAIMPDHQTNSVTERVEKWCVQLCRRIAIELMMKRYDAGIVVGFISQAWGASIGRFLRLKDQYMHL
jgi:hypothetical protein